MSEYDEAWKVFENWVRDPDLLGTRTTKDTLTKAEMRLCEVGETIRKALEKAKVFDELLEKSKGLPDGLCSNSGQKGIPGHCFCAQIFGPQPPKEEK